MTPTSTATSPTYAPRVSGQVARVLVDDNDRVKKGDVLVRLDREPYEVQAALKRAAVESAEANLTAAEAQARGLEAQAVGQRWKLQLASEQVNAQIAQLRALAAALKTRQATLDEAQSEYERARRLLASSAVSREDFDQHESQFRVADAAAAQAPRGRLPGPGGPRAAAPGPGQKRTSRPCRRTSTRPPRRFARRWAS